MDVDAGDEPCQITIDEFDDFSGREEECATITVCAKAIKSVIFTTRISGDFREIDVSLSSSSSSGWLNQDAAASQDMFPIYYIPPPLSLYTITRILFAVSVFSLSLINKRVEILI